MQRSDTDNATGIHIQSIIVIDTKTVRYRCTFQRRCFHISASPQLSFLDFLHVRWHLVSLNICKLPCFHILGGPLSLTSAGFRLQGVSIRSSKVNITLTKPFISDIYCIFKAFICAPMHTITLEHAFSTCCLSEIIVRPGGEGT